jgi:multisubunit Na+/H+ antiporter MnhG subunit
MSSLTDYFERIARRQNESPSSMWPFIIAGVIFLFAGSIAEIRMQDFWRVAAWVTQGFGMIAYGVTQMKFRGSKLYVPSVILSLALWFGGAFLIFRAYL